MSEPVRLSLLQTPPGCAQGLRGAGRSWCFLVPVPRDALPTVRACVWLDFGSALGLLRSHVCMPGPAD